ncbi:MAG: hypothetical protein PHO06_00055 [Clostridia bacterium]|nr:hypothetical protein [Clostridia bacterium]
MQKTKSNSGFTSIEIVIIIAFIAILAAVLIPTYTNLAKQAARTVDMQLTSSMNTIISEYGNEIENFQDVVFFLNQEGYSIEKLNPTSDGFRFVWEANTNQILLLNEQFEVVPDKNIRSYNPETWQLWLTVKSPSELIVSQKIKINCYLANDYNGNFEIRSLSIFETGNNVINGNVVYITSSNGQATISGTINGTLTINAPNATINQYGKVKKISVLAVGNNSLKINGYVENLELKNGKVELIPASYVKTLNFVGEKNIMLVNGGMISEIKNDTLPTNATFVNETGFVENIPEGMPIQNSENFKVSIGNLTQLQSFRDAVNHGANFVNITVQLTADIVLPNGWTPIGEFARSSVETTNIEGEIVYNEKIVGFAGIFDGNNREISNLNNKGYVPNAIKAIMKNKTTIDGKAEFVYGFFGVVSGATIKDLSITNVDIDIPLETTYGDSVAAIVGLSVKDLTLIGCETTGIVKAYDGVGGLVGRSYFANQISFDNCENNIQVYGIEKAAGLLGCAEKLSGENQSVMFNFCSNLATVNAGIENERTKDDIAIAAGMTSYTSSEIASYNFTNCENHGNISVNYTNSEKAYASSFVVKIDEPTISETDAIKDGIIKINGEIQSK